MAYCNGAIKAHIVLLIRFTLDTSSLRYFSLFIFFKGNCSTIKCFRHAKVNFFFSSNLATERMKDRKLISNCNRFPPETLSNSLRDLTERVDSNQRITIYHLFTKSSSLSAKYLLLLDFLEEILNANFVRIYQFRKEFPHYLRYLEKKNFFFE